MSYRKNGCFLSADIKHITGAIHKDLIRTFRWGKMGNLNPPSQSALITSSITRTARAVKFREFSWNYKSQQSDRRSNSSFRMFWFSTGGDLHGPYKYAKKLLIQSTLYFEPPSARLQELGGVRWNYRRFWKELGGNEHPGHKQCWNWIEHFLFEIHISRTRVHHVNCLLIDICRVCNQDSALHCHVVIVCLQMTSPFSSFFFSFFSLTEHIF